VTGLQTPSRFGLWRIAIAIRLTALTQWRQGSDKLFKWLKLIFKIKK
jgi:hypothetical protein